MGFTAKRIAWLSHMQSMNRGEESESVKRKSPKKKKRADLKLPNLSGVKFEDTLRALLNTPPPRSKKEKK